MMVGENMTQRGYDDAGAVLDSVAVVIRQTVTENLGDKCTPNSDEYQSSRIVRGDGVGHKAVIDRQPSISERDARDAIKVLKATRSAQA